MYWSPPATGPPTPSLKNGSIFASAPPPWSSTTPVRDADDAQAELGRPARLALPDHADLGEEVVAGRRLLVEPLVAVRAVVADRGGGDEHARARVGRLDPGHEVARAELARGSGCGAWRRRSSAGRRPRPRGGRRASRPASAAVGRGLVLRLPGDGARGGGVARQRGDLVAAGAQPLDELRADQPAGSGDGDVHAGSTARGGSCLTPGSRTCPRAWRDRTELHHGVAHVHHHNSEPHEGLRRRPRRRRPELRDRRGQGRRLPRSERIGQDDDAALARRPRHSHFRHRDDPRRPLRRARRSAVADRRDARGRLASRAHRPQPPARARRRGARPALARRRDARARRPRRRRAPPLAAASRSG